LVKNNRGKLPGLPLVFTSFRYNNPCETLSAHAADQQELLHLQVAAVFFGTFLIFISSTTFLSAIRASGPFLFLNYIIEITPVKILPEGIAQQFRPESASAAALFNLAAVAL
jgi:hypothetical protein